jgi:hypothetical protein
LKKARPARPRVGYPDVGQLAIGEFIDAPTVVFDPGALSQFLL